MIQVCARHPVSSTSAVQEGVERQIRALKHPGDPGSVGRLPIGGPTQVCGHLRPVAVTLPGQLEKDASLIAEWRNRCRESFFTWIEATQEETAAWLRDCYGPNDADILFMVEDAAKEPLGHLALYDFDFEQGRCEFGRVVRGSDRGPRGAMTLASKALLNWAYASLGVRQVFLEVFEANSPAVRLYERVGFRAVARVPLKRHTTGNGVQWTSVDDERSSGTGPDAYALRMLLDRFPI